MAGFGHCQAIPQAALSVTASFARCSPSLFHQSHFDWETGTLFRGWVWTLPGDSAGRAVSNAFDRTVLAIFISPITL